MVWQTSLLKNKKQKTKNKKNLDIYLMLLKRLIAGLSRNLPKVIILSFYRADYDNFMFKTVLEEPRKTYDYITLWVRNPLRRGVLDPTLCDGIC